MIDYWKKYNRIPYDYNNPQDNAIYMILFFEGKRALFLNKQLKCLGTFETRKAKQLLDDAIGKGWMTQTLENCKFGERPDHYPTKSSVGYWIEIK